MFTLSAGHHSRTITVGDFSAREGVFIVGEGELLTRPRPWFHVEESDGLHGSTKPGPEDSFH